MIYIQKYIAELIGNHECVIVPGLGAFVAQASSAEIHPITHKFTAPSRTLSFNAQIKVNDGLLAAEISRKEGISFSEALTSIDEYVKYFNTSLSVLKHYNCVGIGRFFYNSGGKLEFEPEFAINFSSDSFGLPDFVFKPIDRNNTYEMNSPTNHRNAQDASSKELKEEGAKKKTSTAAKIMFVLMPLIVLIGAAGLVVYNQQEDISLGGVHIFESLGLKKNNTVDSSQIVLVDSLITETEVNEEVIVNNEGEVQGEVFEETIIETPVNVIKKTKTVTQVTTSEIATGKYYVVIGSFKNESNADGLYSKLLNSHKGVVKLPLDANGYYKVAVGSYDSMEAANVEYASLQNTYSGSWIKKY
ncbi:SPOR domain-containing protein [uncultured Cytophaga sp.]|uniref:HU domain-containing protein n=1 Tax=uncultured Cytophaga sp. TaxID=160238 RepID=UPI00262909AD|nr:SPOR domain-containing protein [uncultured Cytophaga sp.]